MSPLRCPAEIAGQLDNQQALIQQLLELFVINLTKNVIAFTSNVVLFI